MEWTEGKEADNSSPNFEKIHPGSEFSCMFLVGCTFGWMWRWNGAQHEHQLAAGE